jgi:hypothetical protein
MKGFVQYENLPGSFDIVQSLSLASKRFAGSICSTVKARLCKGCKLSRMRRRDVRGRGQQIRRSRYEMEPWVQTCRHADCRLFGYDSESCFHFLQHVCMDPSSCLMMCTQFNLIMFTYGCMYAYMCVCVCVCVCV